MRYGGHVRTTLDIDPAVLAVARARVSQGRAKNIGEAVSMLARAGLAAEDQPSPPEHGLLLIPSERGHVITDEMVSQALSDE